MIQVTIIFSVPMIQVTIIFFSEYFGAGADRRANFCGLESGFKVFEDSFQMFLNKFLALLNQEWSFQANTQLVGIGEDLIGYPIFGPYFFEFRNHEFAKVTAKVLWLDYIRWRGQHETHRAHGNQKQN